MQKYVIALYIRLSIEDYKYDSLSIENQSLVLNEYAAAMPEYLNAEILEFIDNGYSGTNFERPQVQKLIEMVRANKIDCIIVKDFSLSLIHILMENRSERNRWISQFTQFATLETLDRRALIHMVQSIRVMGKKELEIAFTYEDEYKKALQLIKVAAQSQQAEEFEHRKVG